MMLFNKLMNGIHKVFLSIGVISLMIMMLIVVGNCLGRALFRTPIFGTIEIAGLAGVFVVAIAIGFTEREQRHVTVDVLANRFKPQLRSIIDSITLLLSLVAVAFLLWAIFKDALNSAITREITLTTGMITSPFKFTWAIGITILWLFLLQHLSKALRKVGKK